MDSTFITFERKKIKTKKRNPTKWLKQPLQPAKLLGHEIRWPKRVTSSFGLALVQLVNPNLQSNPLPSSSVGLRSYFISLTNSFLVDFFSVKLWFGQKTKPVLKWHPMDINIYIFITNKFVAVTNASMQINF